MDASCYELRARQPVDASEWFKALSTHVAIKGRSEQGAQGLSEEQVAANAEKQVAASPAEGHIGANPAEEQAAGQEEHAAELHAEDMPVERGAQAEHAVRNQTRTKPVRCTT